MTPIGRSLLHHQIGVRQARRRAGVGNRRERVVLDIGDFELERTALVAVGHVALLARNSDEAAVQPFEERRLLVLGLRLAIFNYLVAVGVEHRQQNRVARRAQAGFLNLQTLQGSDALSVLHRQRDNAVAGLGALGISVGREGAVDFARGTDVEKARVGRRVGQLVVRYVMAYGTRYAVARECAVLRLGILQDRSRQ